MEQLRINSYKYFVKTSNCGEPFHFALLYVVHRRIQSTWNDYDWNNVWGYVTYFIITSRGEQSETVGI